MPRERRSAWRNCAGQRRHHEYFVSSRQPVPYLTTEGLPVTQELTSGWLLDSLLRDTGSSQIPICNRVGCIASTAGDTFHTMGLAPTITIHVPGPLRMYCAGATQLSISARTVRAALEDLERSQYALYRNVCDETGTVRRHLNVYVNSDNMRDLNGVDTALAPGDVVTFLPAISGG